MHRRRLWLLSVLILSIVPVSATAQDGASQLSSTAPIMAQDSMNVFRRFAVDPVAIYEFYGKVLGLKQLTTFDVGRNTSVARFQAGDSQVKFTGRTPNRKYHPGGVQEATGLRLLTFFFPDQSSLMERFRAHGLPAPDFHPVPGSKRTSALVKDPDGQWVEIVIAPDDPPATYNQIEIGLTVSNLDVSRRFYREFVGLEELPPVEDPVFHTTKYPFRHGSTIVSLRSFAKQLPADTGSGGIQYVVSDAKAVQELAKARQVTIAQPLSTLESFSLKTVWLDDPDGITNYFAETAARGQQRPKPKQ
jgi:catechol 2,3-dioxygenase-like lactoylglutathione lyase family enzyme